MDAKNSALCPTCSCDGTFSLERMRSFLPLPVKSAFFRDWVEGRKKGPLTSTGAYISLFFCFPKMVPISWQASGEFVKRGGTEPGGHSVHPFLQKQVVCTQIPMTRQLWVPGSHSVSIVSSTIGVYGQSLHGSGCCQHKKLRAIP